MITLVFSTKGALANALILLGVHRRSRWPRRSSPCVAWAAEWDVIERTMETSSQLPIRVAVVLVFALGALAASLGTGPPHRWLRGGSHHPAGTGRP